MWHRPLYGETGRYPLFIRTAVKCIRYWIKLSMLPTSRICKQAYEMLLVQHEAGGLNWVSKVQKILTENGFVVVWPQGVGYQACFAAEFKDRLLACYKQHWHSKTEISEKLP